jgi:CDP-paratose 2-epimerase
VKCALEEREYVVYGYKGKQVRDNIHSFDVVRAIEEIARAPRRAEAYNIGGGRANSISILEAAEIAYQLTGRRLRTRYVDRARDGDHICYISNLAKLRSHYPGWDVTVGLEQIVKALVAAPERSSGD